MAQFDEGFVGSFAASGALSPFLRVKGSSGQVALAGLTDREEYGTTEGQTFNAGEMIPVRYRNAPGTRKITVNGAVTQDAALYTAANGKVSATAATGGFLWGYAIEAAGADGDIIEALPIGHTGAANP